MKADSHPRFMTCGCPASTSARPGYAGFKYTSHNKKRGVRVRYIFCSRPLSKALPEQYFPVANFDYPEATDIVASLQQCVAALQAHIGVMHEVRQRQAFYHKAMTACVRTMTHRRCCRRTSARFRKSARQAARRRAVFDYCASHLTLRREQHATGL